MKKSILGIVMILGLLSFGNATVLDEAVSWMYDNGLTIFNTTTEYKPNNYIRRDEAAKLFIKFAKLQNKGNYIRTINECEFTDINDAHKDLKDFIIESCRIGIFQGSNGKFMPRNSITNEQAVAVLVRILVGTQIEIKGDRSESYYIKAKTLGMLSQISMNKKKEIATRGNIGLLLATNSKSFDSSKEIISGDFQSELNKCENNYDKVADCNEKVYKKYAITKNNACNHKDGLYQSPLKTTRPDARIMSLQFYKHEKILYYPVITTSYVGDITNNYLYSYNCDTKEASDINIYLAGNSGLKILKGNKNKILLYKYNRSSPGARYSLIDISNNQLINQFTFHNNEDLIKTLGNVLKPFYKIGETNTRVKAGFIEMSSSFGEIPPGVEDAVTINNISDDFIGQISIIVNKYSRDPISKKYTYSISDKKIDLGSINFVTNTYTSL